LSVAHSPFLIERKSAEIFTNKKIYWSLIVSSHDQDLSLSVYEVCLQFVHHAQVWMQSWDVLLTFRSQKLRGQVSLGRFLRSWVGSVLDSSRLLLLDMEAN
jgi:hypothetical protein